MSDLASRVLETITETERIARAAAETSSAEWTVHQQDEDASVLFQDALKKKIFLDEIEPGEAEHIARQDPAAVLRRCAADRKMVREFISIRDNPARHHDTGLHLIYHVRLETVTTLAEGYGITA